MLFLIRILGILLTFRINPSVMSCSKLHAESEYLHCFVVNFRVASHLFTGGLAGIGKLPVLVGRYIRYGITLT